MFTTVEKVIFLQDIDIFEYTSTEDLSNIAAITEEVPFPPHHTIYKEGEESDSIYLVIEGGVRLHRNGTDVMVAGSKDAFGTWALFDDEPRIVSATTTEDSLLLRIDKEDFFDLLSDNISITQSLFKALVKRVRELM